MNDLGTKYVCFKCQTRFYDLKRPAPICPKCGADQREMPIPTKTDRKRGVPAAPASRLEAVAEADDLPALPVDADEEEEEDEEEDDE